MNLRLADLDIQLLPEMAAWLPGHGALLVSDLHLGKSATFRTRGIPIPEGETGADLVRLAALIERTAPDRVVILGDLVHAVDGLQPGVLRQLREFLSAERHEILLVEGNHDRAVRLRDRGLPLEIVPTREIDGVTLVHDPADLPGAVPAICGHLHPATRVPVTPRHREKVPCFLLRDDVLVLPGFGSFTGTHAVEPRPCDRVFLPARDEVRELPADP